MIDHRIFPKRAIFHMLLLLAWERGEWSWAGRLSVLCAKGLTSALAAVPLRYSLYDEDAGVGSVAGGQPGGVPPLTQPPGTPARLAALADVPTP